MQRVSQGLMTLLPFQVDGSAVLNPRLPNLHTNYCSQRSIAKDLILREIITLRSTTIPEGHVPELMTKLCLTCFRQAPRQPF
jgi:hypothetical protein